MSLKSVFRQLGISEMEVETLVLLLSEPAGMSVLKMSRKMGLPRTTLYGHLESLIGKGLVKKGIVEGGSLFYAEEIGIISDIFSEKKKSVDEARKEFEKIVTSEFVAPSYNPKFSVYDRPGAAEAIFHDILRSRVKRACWFWPVGEMIQVVPGEVFAAFQVERVRRGIGLDVLWPEKRGVNLKEHPYLTPEHISLRDIRILPKEIDQMMGYGIYGNKVAFISSKREHFGFVIDSKEMSETFQSQFDYFWKVSKPYGGD